MENPISSGYKNEVCKWDAVRNYRQLILRKVLWYEVQPLQRKTSAKMLCCKTVVIRICGNAPAAPWHMQSEVQTDEDSSSIASQSFILQRLANN